MQSELKSWSYKESTMSESCDASNVSRRQFLVLAGSVAAASSFAFGKDTNSALPPAPVPVATYPVAINTATKPLSYTTPKLSDASILRVKAGETVAWVANPTTQYRVAILFFPNTPFTDSHGNRVYAFEGPDSDAANGKIGGTIAGPDGTYPYCVAVFDDANVRTYTDDPKIIVGNGDEARAEIASALADLKDADAKLSNRPQVRKQIEAIEHKLERLVDELK
jgi:hypothetical protein